VIPFLTIPRLKRPKLPPFPRKVFPLASVRGLSPGTAVWPMYPCGLLTPFKAKFWNLVLCALYKCAVFFFKVASDICV